MYKYQHTLTFEEVFSLEQRGNLHVLL